MPTAMHPLNDHAAPRFESSTWWTDEEGTTWPPCLVSLIATPRHRARLRERASTLGHPQLIAYALHTAHQTNPITSLELLKETFDRMAKHDYDFSAATTLQAVVTDNDTLSPSSVAACDSGQPPLAKVYPFPSREGEVDEKQRTPIAAPDAKLRQSLANAEAKLQMEIRQGRVPSNVDTCRTLIRQVLGIRRRRPSDSDANR